MCGIFGFYSGAEESNQQWTRAMEILFRASNSRGKEASGVAILHSDVNSKNEHIVEYTKTDTNALGFLKSSSYKKLILNTQNTDVIAYLGHSRMTTHGSQLFEKNNQPVFSEKKKIYCVHNGIIANYEQLWKKFIKQRSQEQKLPDLDTQVLVDIFEKMLETYTLNETLYRMFHEIEGVVNLVTMISDTSTLVLSSNTGSLYWFEDSLKNIFFASEKIFLSELIKKLFKNEFRINRVNPVSAVIINKDRVEVINLAQKPDSSLKLPNNPKTTVSKITYKNIQEEENVGLKKVFLFKNTLEKLQQHDFDYQKIDDIPRCTRCILPITTPFIHLNEHGVCNYCLEHTKISHKGRKSLEQILHKYRKSNGDPDCLIAFSGGRDSSYGLHLLKKELGMNPLAYTYDWGMVSDLGRRNQARMLGALGVEQILISADITQKRKHVRENILAWIQNPHLGMIPLFTEGDKQCEFYADQIMKKYDLKLMIYCRGNDLEKEEFKAGHSGVKDADRGGVIHNLALKNKLKLLQFYGLQYLRNPAYLNSSLVDTAFAFFSTYIQPHNYVYLWHYLPWEEQKINHLLTETYHWEVSPDTSTTWRIGDGTPAFYNYIYYQVQGFTENDSLRARQVREGILSREEALRLVKEENRPQYNNLKWYFDTLGLDGDLILSVVDKMKKLY